MRFRKLMVFLLAFGVAGALFPTHASAAFRLRVDDPISGKGVVISDGSLGDISGVDDGIIMFMLSGLGGDATASVTIAQGRQAQYSTDPNVIGDLYLNSLTISSTSRAKLILTLEDTGYTSNPGTLLLTSHLINDSPVPGEELGYFNAATGSSVKIQSYITSSAAPVFGDDTGPTPTAGLPPLGSLDGNATDAQYLSPGSSVTGDQSVSFLSSGLYSLFTQVTVELTGVGSAPCHFSPFSDPNTPCGEVSFYQDASVVATGATGDGAPEPASLMLISSGLVGLAGAGRRRFRKNRG